MATEYTNPEPEPKFWDEEDKRIYHGFQCCFGPFPLVSLAGTYRWVFLSQTSWGSIEFRYESDPEVVKKEYPGYPGYFKIRFPKHKKPSIKNLKGKFKFYDLKGAFVGLNPHEKDDKTSHKKDDDSSDDFTSDDDTSDEKDDDGTMEESTWEIKKMEWNPYNSGESYDTTGHGVEVSKIVDDNGNRFVTLVWDQGWWGCSPHHGFWVGKKQSDDKALVGLTDAERERLGMYLTEDEVEARAATQNTKNAAKVTDNKRKASDGGRDVKRKLEVDDSDGERDVKRKRED